MQSSILGYGSRMNEEAGKCYASIKNKELKIKNELQLKNIHKYAIITTSITEFFRCINFYSFGKMPSIIHSLENRCFYNLLNEEQEIFLRGLCEAYAGLTPEECQKNGHYSSRFEMPQGGIVEGIF